MVQIIEEATDLHKKQATVVTKLDEIIRILVSGKAVKFRVLSIRPKQSDVACAKMVNLAVSQARQNLLESKAKSALECNRIL